MGRTSSMSAPGSMIAEYDRPSLGRLAFANNNTYVQFPTGADSDSDSEVCRMASMEQQQTEQQSDGFVAFGHALLQDVRFEVFMAVLVLVNAIVIGFETDMPGHAWHYVELVFLTMFGAELALRMSVYKKSFFSKGPDLQWNMFDISVVALGVVDFVAEFLLGANEIRGMLQSVRILRIIRVFRILRFLRKVYMLAYGLVEAAQAVCWVTVLLSFALYIISIFLVRFVGRPREDDPHREFLTEHFGAIPRSMFSMFELMASPNLAEYAEQDGMLWSHPHVTLFIVTFTIFGYFGMMALFTGVISESIFEKNRIRSEEERFEREEVNRCMQELCEEMFQTLETNPEGEASVEDVRTLIPTIEHMLSEMQIEFVTADLQRTIDCMDMNDSKGIGEKEFVSSVMSVASGMGAVRLQELYHALCLVNIKMSKMESCMQKEQVPVIQKLDASLEELLEVRQDVQSLKTDVSGVFQGVAHQLNSRMQPGVLALQSALVEDMKVLADLQSMVDQLKGSTEGGTAVVVAQGQAVEKEELCAATVEDTAFPQPVTTAAAEESKGLDKTAAEFTPDRAGRQTELNAVLGYLSTDKDAEKQPTNSEARGGRVGTKEARATWSTSNSSELWYGGPAEFAQEVAANSDSARQKFGSAPLPVSSDDGLLWASSRPTFHLRRGSGGSTTRGTSLSHSAELVLPPRGCLP